jgi:hypothetical protein
MSDEPPMPVQKDRLLYLLREYPCLNLGIALRLSRQPEARAASLEGSNNGE